MAREYNTNGLGLSQDYGKRNLEETFGGSVKTFGGYRTVNYTVDLAEVITGAPTTSNEIISVSLSDLEHVFPAYAKIKAVRAEVVEAVVTLGGTAAASASLQVGLEETDGTAIDVDGFIDATDGALTIASNDIVHPRGAWLRGNSAALVSNYQYDGDSTGAPVDVTYVEATSIGATPGNLTAKIVIDDITAMTSISGKLKIVVEYFPEGN